MSPSGDGKTSLLPPSGDAKTSLLLPGGAAADAADADRAGAASDTSLRFRPVDVGARLSRIKALQIGRKPATMIPLGALAGLTGIVASAGYAWLAGTLNYGPGSSQDAGLLLWGTGIILFAPRA